MSAAIDVLIPVFNAARTVRSALESITGQTVGNIRIVVVDDGSTDQTGAILAEMAARDGRIEVISTANRGIVEALNTGLAACRAPLVARHDGDDLAFPHRLATQLAYMERHPDCVALGANAHHIDAAGRRTGTGTQMVGDVRPNPDAVPAMEPYLLHPMLMVRRWALEQVGGYRHVIHAEDTDLYWRLMDIGRLTSLPDVLGEYRLHSGSISGASALNGRVSAANSQRAALSFRRRRAGRPDLIFAPSGRADYERAGSFAAIAALATADLDPGEAAYLRVAMAVKLLMLDNLRAYDLTADDCMQIRCAIDRHFAGLSPANRARVRRGWLAAIYRMAKRNRLAEAHALAPRYDRLGVQLTRWLADAVDRRVGATRTARVR